jgi:uncharacterized membrane protein YgdD (TMEM256/DUF423 family)
LFYIKSLPTASRYFIAVAAFLGAMAVMFGAYASHGLSAWATPSQVSQVQLAVQYQLFHSVTLLVVALLSGVITAGRFTTVLLSISLWSFSVGILCFSGSLYYLVFAGSIKFVLLTPFGGLLLICGWLCLGISMLLKADNR